MTKTKNKVNVFLIVLILLLVAGSVFAFSYKSKNNDLVVHADSTTTNFYGSSVYVPFTSYQQNAGTNFSAMIWTNAPVDFYGNYIWTDGVDYYYSSNTSQYVIDFNTHTWSAMTWSGLTSFYGNYIWTDGIDYYYSNGNSKYVLDVSTHVWTTMIWNGSNASDGRLIWTDGVNYYYSSGISQFVLDVSSHTWSAMTWHGVSNFAGNMIWTDGVNYYYSSGNSQYVLDVSSHTWSAMTWSGLTSFDGNYIWTDGIYNYYSYAGTQYILDKASVSITDNVYFNSVNFSFIDNGNNTFSLKHNSLFYLNYNNTQSYSISDKFAIYDPNSTSIDPNSFVDSLLINSVSGLSNEYFIPFMNSNVYNYARLSVSCNALSSVNFVKVVFESTYINSPGSNIYYVNNILTYTNSLNESISLKFLYSTNGTYTLNYFGDSSQFMYQLFDNIITSLDDYKFCFNYRAYYLNNDYLNSQQYQSGYSSGYQRGKNDGYNDGYSAGTSAVSESQYNAGYAAGYSAGVAGSNNYSFIGLISAVIDAPIQAFTGLFNFELLGVNILGFITSLFTLAVIITIVKKVV